MSQPDERRRYFRIEDTVSFTVSMIDPGELQTKIDTFWDKKPVYSAYHQSNQEVEQHLADLEVIEKSMPELARYLSVLQSQIDSLTTAKALPGQISIANDTQQVSLSGQGMAYASGQKLATNDMVELFLKLSSTGQMIKIFAQVVEVERISEQYRISLDFTHIYESDQEILIKRIHAQQLKDIAAARSTARE
jgi:hypothetical protein